MEHIILIILLLNLLTVLVEVGDMMKLPMEFFLVILVMHFKVMRVVMVRWVHQGEVVEQMLLVTLLPSMDLLLMEVMVEHEKYLLTSQLIMELLVPLQH